MNLVHSLASESPRYHVCIPVEHFTDFHRPKTQALEKEWQAAVPSAEDQLISVDCHTDRDQCAEYQVTSYPTLRLFQNGKPVVDYSGPRRSSAYGDPARWRTGKTADMIKDPEFRVAPFAARFDESIR